MCYALLTNAVRIFMTIDMFHITFCENIFICIRLNSELLLEFVGRHSSGLNDMHV